MARRAVFFDLWRIRFPVGAVASFLHRVSGVLLLLSLPLLLVALRYSLAGQREFDVLAELARTPWARVLTTLVIWALLHHVLAGIRHLLMDTGVGWRLALARRSAWVANASAVVLTALAAGAFA